jgi:hypothetical protein
MLMLLRWTNSPTNVQDKRNNILKYLLYWGLIVYIDEVLIYAENQKMYNNLIKEILKQLADNTIVI